MHALSGVQYLTKVRMRISNKGNGHRQLNIAKQVSVRAPFMHRGAAGHLMLTEMCYLAQSLPLCFFQWAPQTFHSGVCTCLSAEAA